LDLLIIDAAYLKKEYPQKLGWGHSTFEDIFEIAEKARVKQLVFFHHDPNRTDADLTQIGEYYNNLVEQRKKISRAVIASEGLNIVI